MRVSILIAGFLIAKALRPDWDLTGLYWLVVMLSAMDALEWGQGMWAHWQAQTSDRAQERGA